MVSWPASAVLSCISKTLVAIPESKLFATGKIFQTTETISPANEKMVRGATRIEKFAHTPGRPRRAFFR